LQYWPVEPGQIVPIIFLLQKSQPGGRYISYDDVGEILPEYNI
jgi:hypothetical protein